MKKTFIIALLAIITISLASCGSDEPQWADPEAHEKTEQLRAQYTPFIVGTWHYEEVGEKQRAFEQLTFNADGTLSGRRKWQARQVVTINGQEQYTDWEDIPQMNGTFTGTWSLVWERLRVGDESSGMRNDKVVGENRLYLHAQFDDKTITALPYSNNVLFDYADANTLRFAGFYWHDSDGWIIYERGEAEPSF